MSHVTVGHTFTEPANSCGIIHSHYSITWPPVCLESWPQFHIYCYALCVSSTSICWPTWNCIIFISYCTWTKILSIRRNICCSPNCHPFSTSMDKRIFKWQLTQVPVHWQLYVPACSPNSPPVFAPWYTLAQVIVHSSIFSLWSGFRKLATWVIWAALNGTKGGQLRQVSLYQHQGRFQTEQVCFPHISLLSSLDPATYIHKQHRPCKDICSWNVSGVIVEVYGKSICINAFKRFNVCQS
jgi:hypothetical protein